MFSPMSILHIMISRQHVSSLIHNGHQWVVSVLIITCNPSWMIVKCIHHHQWSALSVTINYHPSSIQNHHQWSWRSWLSSSSCIVLIIIVIFILKIFVVKTIVITFMLIIMILINIIILILFLILKLLKDPRQMQECCLLSSIRQTVQSEAVHAGIQTQIGTAEKTVGYICRHVHES